MCQRTSSSVSVPALATAVSLLVLGGCVGGDPGWSETDVEGVEAGGPRAIVANHGWDPSPPEAVDGSTMSVELSGAMFGSPQEVTFVFEAGVWLQTSASPTLRDAFAPCTPSDDVLAQGVWTDSPRFVLQTGGWVYMMLPVWSSDYTWQGDAWPAGEANDDCWDSVEAFGESLPTYPELLITSLEL